MDMNKAIHRFIAILIPTTFLGISFFWWKRKKTHLKSIDDRNNVKQTDVQDSKSILIGNSSPKDIMHVDESILEYRIEQEDKDTNTKYSPEKISETNLEAISPKVTVVEEDVMAIEMVDDECGSNSLDLDEVDVFPETEENIFVLSKKRQRNQSSSCDNDSAIVEDYSSDSISISETDSIPKSPESEDILNQMMEAIENIKLSDVDADLTEQCSTDWYDSELPKETIPWHSFPMSDTERSDVKHETVFDSKGDLTTRDEHQSSDKRFSEKSSKSLRSRAHNIRRGRESPKKIPSSPTKSHSSPSKRKSSPRKSRDRLRKSESRETEKPWRELEDDLISSDDLPEVIDYEFPDAQCGKLIGKSGKNVQDIKHKTGATICIEAEMFNENRILSISGLKSQVRRAEKILLEKFENDLLKIKEVTREIAATYMSHVELEESCDVIITAIVDAGNFFVQMFKPEVDQLLLSLHADLESVYSCPRSKYLFSIESPPKENDVCIANIDNTWCRLKVKQVFAEEKQAVVVFLDYGGDITVPMEILLRIRSDFLDIPCQAVEVYLSHVVPLTYEEEYSYDANCLFGQLVEGKLLQSVISSKRNKKPCVELSFVDQESQQVVSVNCEMANWNLVRWVNL